MNRARPTGESATALPRRSRPSVLTVLAWHVVFTLLYAALFSNVIWLMPLLVRIEFGAADETWRNWQTTIVTAALPTLMTFSIFWGELLRRLRLRTFLLLFWVVAALPLGLVALAQQYTHLLACHVVASIGVSGWPPAHAKLLKHFYSDAKRGRAFALVNLATLAGGSGSAFVLGRWMDANPQAFRVYLPALVGAQLIGILILLLLAWRTDTPDVPEAAAPISWRSLLQPVLHMGAVLKADRTFLKYENAFMTYGAAYMLCEALLPVLGTDRLHMGYQEYAHSTQMVARLAMLALTLPMGWLLDRVGPVRTSGLAFGVLSIYPLLLISAGGVPGVAVASVVWGIGMAGVMMGWMLGPVTLAGSAEKVPQYVAIHATLVGLRGILFQFLGMGLYQLTGEFTWPLAGAALAFAFAAAQMWLLHGRTHVARGAALPAAETE